MRSGGSFLLAAALGPVLAMAAWPAPTGAVSATPVTAHAKGSGAWLKGDRLLVKGSGLGLASEKDARRWALKDAAAKAAAFLDQQSPKPEPLLLKQVQEALLRESPLPSVDVGPVRVEDSYQERWTNEEGVDRWSIHLTLSIRLRRAAKK
jgi:hypothetical protein